jgi:hypothetical protein
MVGKSVKSVFNLLEGIAKKGEVIRPSAACMRARPPPLEWGRTAWKRGKAMVE